MTCRDCGGLVTWRGPCAALTHTQCHSCGAVNSQVESAWPPDDDDDGESGEEEQPRLMEIEAGWASHPSSTVEMVLARVSGSGVSTNMRDEAMADLWPAFQRWVEAYGWPDHPAEEPEEDK